MKMLVVFEKAQRLRFIGHLDLMRTMQRALRRSDLPIRYSQGFNPHILLSFASPLSVGVIGKREVMEVPLEGNVSPEEFMQKFATILPMEIRCLEARPCEDQHPSPMALLYAAGYRCRFDEPVTVLQQKADAYMSQKSIPAVRRTKSGDKPCDLRPMIQQLSFTDDYTLTCTLDLRESSTCKPELVINTLSAFAGFNPEDLPHYMLERVQLYGLQDEALVPLETL